MALSCSRLKSQTSFRSDTTGLVNFPEGNEEIVDTNMCCDLCIFGGVWQGTDFYGFAAVILATL